jgi:hypothetical protein
VTDETLILSPEDLDEAAKAGTDEEDLDKTMVLSMDNIPNPWRDEEDEVLDLFGKEGKTKVYQDEEMPSETMVLDRKALKDELAEEQAEVHAILERLCGGALNHRTIGQRIAEGDAYLDHGDATALHGKNHIAGALEGGTACAEIQA